MKWTPQEFRQKKKQDKQSKWHYWFAWYPCRCNDGAPDEEQVVVWLQWCMRRRVWSPARGHNDAIEGMRLTRTIEYHAAQLLKGDKT